MSHTTGADVPAAIRHLAESGYTVARLASDLLVAPSTIYRWRSGKHAPNAGNFEALREWADQTYAVEAHRRTITTKALHLQEAYEALRTAAERAEVEALAQRLADTWAERDLREAAEQEARDARARQIRDEVMARPVSAYGSVDPFAVVASGQPREVAMFG